MLSARLFRVQDARILGRAMTTLVGQSKAEVGPLDELVRTFLEPQEFYNALQTRGIDFYTGVPDSLLKDMCAYVTDHTPKERHIIAANEGAAVAIGCGYHFATRRIPLVYLQNSGFGNTVNPLLSLADSDVYSVPMLLLIGWRGEPGKRDEPQHRVQGHLTPGMLAALNLPFEVLPDYKEGAEEVLDAAVAVMKKRSSPFALLVKRQTFAKYSLKHKTKVELPLTREEFMDFAVGSLGAWDVVVSTTGFASRELFELRARRGQGHERDFLTVGSMGHASSIALGVALSKPSRQVFVFDGDGAALMHMGTIGTIGTVRPKNLKHIVMNNGCHDSVGGQPTQGFSIDFAGIAKACGYTWTRTATTAEEVQAGLAALKAAEGPALLEVRIRPGARSDLGRPTSSTIANKTAFMSFLDN